MDFRVQESANKIEVHLIFPDAAIANPWQYYMA